MNAPAAPSRKPEWLRGPLAWMAANPVAANLLMLVLLIGGWIIGSGVKQEVFPEFDADLVTIDIAYPGASPEAVEQGVVLAIEDAVRGIDGVKSVQSTSYEGAGFVLAEIITGQDADKITTDVKNAVDRITSFPEDAERPVTSLIAIKAKVITLMLHGQAELATLRELAERARTDLLNRPDITEVVMANAPPREISIEVPSSALHAYCTLIAALVVLPIALHMPLDQALPMSLGITALSLLLSLPRMLMSVSTWKLRAIGCVALVAAFGLLWGLRGLIPPAGLWVRDARIAHYVDGLEPGPSVQRMTVDTLRAQGASAFVAVRAPVGLSQAVVFEWRQHGESVDRIPALISGGREEGFRTHSRKENFPADPRGRWRVDLRTPDGQLIARMRFVVE